MELDEIELVYEKAENNQLIANFLETLETQALEEAKMMIDGPLKGSVLNPGQFDALPDTRKEKVMNVLGNGGIASFDIDMHTATVIIKLSSVINRVQACTVFNILNRIEKLDGAINLIIPKWTLDLQVPIGGKKGLFQWEMMIMQLYPWLSVKEESTDEMAIRE